MEHANKIKIMCATRENFQFLRVLKVAHFLKLQPSCTAAAALENAQPSSAQVRWLPAPLISHYTFNLHQEYPVSKSMYRHDPEVLFVAPYRPVGPGALGCPRSDYHLLAHLRCLEY